MATNKNTLINVSSEHKGTVIVVALLLLVTIFLLMWLTVSLSFVREELKATKTEIRILQMHYQDHNAILIRTGIAKPGDYTTGPTNPDKLEEK